MAKMGALIYEIEWLLVGKLMLSFTKWFPSRTTLASMAIFYHLLQISPTEWWNEAKPHLTLANVVRVVKFCFLVIHFILKQSGAQLSLIV